jgi:hypothetical protein
MVRCRIACGAPGFLRGFLLGLGLGARERVVECGKPSPELAFLPGDLGEPSGRTGGGQVGFGRLDLKPGEVVAPASLRVEVTRRLQS